MDAYRKWAAGCARPETSLKRRQQRDQDAPILAAIERHRLASTALDAAMLAEQSEERIDVTVDAEVRAFWGLVRGLPYDGGKRLGVVRLSVGICPAGGSGLRAPGLPTEARLELPAAPLGKPPRRDRAHRARKPIATMVWKGAPRSATHVEAFDPHRRGHNRTSS
jgi:hypothetical protein